MVTTKSPRFTDSSSPTGLPEHEVRAMSLALEEARAALDHGDVPVGAVVLNDGEVISRRHNERELLGDPTAHAEILAIRDAAAALGSWRLGAQTTLVVTLEPCAMCAGALLAARVGRLVFGAPDPKAGACGSVLSILNHPQLNHRVEVTSGLLAEECGALLTNFFRSRRDAMKFTTGPEESR